MTYVYGATLLGTAQHVEHEMYAAGVDWEGLNTRKLTQYAGKKLFYGIASTVPAAAQAMRWLQDVARQQPSGTRMEWTTPIGFKVQHDYQTYEEVQVRVRSCGLVHTLVRMPDGGTNGIRMRNAISPNFVHALDSTHLALTALAMQSAGCNLAAIHDSVGTHPSDVAQMHRLVRQAFVEMYSGTNLLGEFLWEVQGVGEAPLRGTLDVAKVLDSEFFFC